MSGRVDAGCQGYGDDSGKTFEHDPVEFSHDSSLEGPKNRGILHPGLGWEIGCHFLQSFAGHGFCSQKNIDSTPIGTRISTRSAARCYDLIRIASSERFAVRILCFPFPRVGVCRNAHDWEPGAVWVGMPKNFCRASRVGEPSFWS
jgi:hypothetical protein